MSNFLYVVQSQGYHKIGIAEDMDHRLTSLQTGNPFEITVHKVYRFDHPQAVEIALHDLFKSKRKMREWFLLSSDDLVKIDEICILLGGARVTENEWGTTNDDSDLPSFTDDDYLDLITSIMARNPKAGRSAIRGAIKEACLPGIGTERIRKFQKVARSLTTSGGFIPSRR